MTVNSFYKSCLLTKVHERQLSRVGIYNNIVSAGDAIEEILDGNLKSDFWEFQEFHENQPKVMPTKVEKKTKYTGSKRKTIKEIVIKVKNSSMFYSLHSLTRYRERSWGNQEIKIDDFFSIDERWVKKLFDAGFGSSYLDGKNRGAFRQDILVPYGDGAFLGDVGLMGWYSPNRVDTYTKSYHKGIPSNSMSQVEKNEVFLPIFTTRTYIGREDFTWFQEDIFRQYHSNDLDDAIEIIKNNRMKEEHWMYQLNQ